MEQIYNTTDLIRLENKNIKINFVWKHQTHIEIRAKLDYLQRQMEKFNFKNDYNQLPQVMSWDEFSHRKAQLSFVAQDFETKKILAILDNTRQTTIRNHFLKYPLNIREQVKVVTVDMSQNYIPLIPKLFPKAKIVIDRFHIVQHLKRAMMTTRIVLMKEFDKFSHPYRSLKNHWKLFQKRVGQKSVTRRV